MSETVDQTLSGVPETLLIPLYLRAMESRRPDALIKDERAMALVAQMDFSRVRRIRMNELLNAMRMMFTREFDRYAREFLSRHQQAVVVHIGCGLDTRFERVDDGRVEWFDMDLPVVMALRKLLTHSGSSRYHALTTSVFDDGWFEEVSRFKSRPIMFLAEGVFPYFEETQIKSLFLKLRDRFPGAELVCDAHTPFVIWTDNLQLALSKVSARLRWGLKHGKDVESWGEGLVLLDEWFYFDDPEPRMRPYHWMRLIPLVAKSTGIFHYRLGN